ncbi:uncharacterized protein RHIMIDRAFT_310158 [Rhizopus microsporus ATCC 52813]|uniref:Uncharacterized protein n=1 Tax=Rhizopus microsporus ATCC 52813 TaxID=1340429 RepID=A0A2G4T8V8_RHIZD|nr:uncharacterized protein RHIMIDRAFT_310158 [Rhizopus microsporus ATCC 52813]PHZ17442.1 hypothetical protein RHIMIDRAFT_310158 [Rhizopus microsporus ATCC 52813]
MLCKATAIDAFDASDTTAANKEDTKDNACPALFVQEPHPLGKFKELAMRQVMKVMKVAVKQRKVRSSLKGKEVLDFVPYRPHSPFHSAPSMSQLVTQFPLAPSISKVKGKEVPLHRPSSATINKLPVSNSVSEVFDATSATSNKLTVTDTKPFVRKVKDVELEEGETINPCPPLHQTQQACSRNNNELSCFKHNEAHGNQSVSRSAVKDTAINSTAASTKRALSATAPIYYTDKQRTSDKPSESVTAWKTLLSLGDMLLASLNAQEQYLLYGICLRLVAMVRFRILDRMQGEVRSVLARHLQAPSVSDDLQYTKMSRNLLEEYEQSTVMNASSKEYLTTR